MTDIKSLDEIVHELNNVSASITDLEGHVGMWDLTGETVNNDGSISPGKPSEHAEEVYAKLGVSKITLQANYAVGGYTWARQGYDFIHRDDRIALKQMFTSEVKRKHQRGDISDNELDSLLLDVKSLQHAWEFAWWNPTDEVDGKHFGKEFMLGSDWMAQKSLNPDSLGYKIGKLYYAGKNKKASVTG